MIRKVWSDSVGSKLIAEAIKELVKWGWGLLIVPLFALANSLYNSISFVDSFKQVFAAISQFLVTGFQVNVLTIILIVVAYIVLTFLLKKVFTSSSTKKIKSYKSDTLLRAIIEWKWVKEDGKLQIKYDDYSLICPICSHDLEMRLLNGYYHLKCKNMSCSFVSDPYHKDAHPNAVVMMDMNTHYFHQALQSIVNAKLRNKGINIS